MEKIEENIEKSKNLFLAAFAILNRKTKSNKTKTRIFIISP